MLSPTEVRSVVDSLTYRPGTSFSVYTDPHEGLHLAIVAEVDDAYHPDQKVTLDIHSALPPFADEDALLAWMSWRLQRIESHESREWLRRNGSLVSDPHCGSSP